MGKSRLPRPRASRPLREGVAARQAAAAAAAAVAPPPQRPARRRVRRDAGPAAAAILEKAVRRPLTKKQRHYISEVCRLCGLSIESLEDRHKSMVAHTWCARRKRVLNRAGQKIRR